MLIYCHVGLFYYATTSLNLQLIYSTLLVPLPFVNLLTSCHPFIVLVLYFYPDISSHFLIISFPSLLIIMPTRIVTQCLKWKNVEKCGAVRGYSGNVLLKVNTKLVNEKYVHRSVLFHLSSVYQSVHAISSRLDFISLCIDQNRHHNYQNWPHLSFLVLSSVSLRLKFLYSYFTLSFVHSFFSLFRLFQS